jgi:hypothetical protein
MVHPTKHGHRRSSFVESRIQLKARIQEGRMITTTESLLRDVPKIIRVAAYLVLSLGISAISVFAEDESPLRVTHVLGLEGIRNNANGNLSIQEDVLQFRKADGPAAQIRIGSIINVSLGEQDKQMGGTAMTVGKAATPFGGGRVISLFSHKKYDTLTVEYSDANGGLRGAIFQLNSGQRQIVKDKLMAGGAATADSDQAAKVNDSEIKNENK